MGLTNRQHGLPLYRYISLFKYQIVYINTVIIIVIILYDLDLAAFIVCNDIIMIELISSLHKCINTVIRTH